MNRLLGGLFEAAHLLGTAFLFAVAAGLVFLVNPNLVDESGVSREQAFRLFGALADAVAEHGPLLAGSAAAGALEADDIEHFGGMLGYIFGIGVVAEIRLN